MPPYLPFLEALGAYVAAAPLEAVRADIGSGVASVARVLAEVSERLGEVNLCQAYRLSRTDRVCSTPWRDS
jgi:hypothetical protein